jgi:hypothetical protein
MQTIIADARIRSVIGPARDSRMHLTFTLNHHSDLFNEQVQPVRIILQNAP